jgi:hypothetical protein
MRQGYTEDPEAGLRYSEGQGLASGRVKIRRPVSSVVKFRGLASSIVKVRRLASAIVKIGWSQV